MSHDPQKILTEGDSLEKYFGERILGTIPSYATIWATYVGNDGSQNPLPMPGADKEAYENRAILWQRLYTLFESLALSWVIEKYFNHRDTIKDHEDYAWNLNQWTAFYAHLGRIHDMAEGITAQLRQTTLFAPFDPFYEQRHIALHGIKVPMCWAENVLCAPILGEEKNRWHTKMQWGELGTEHFDLLSSQCSGTLRALETVIEVFCAQVLSLVSPRLSLTPVEWSLRPALMTTLEVRAVPVYATQSTVSIDPSGTQRISGYSDQRDMPGGLD